MTEKLFKFAVSVGRMGDLEGLFVAEEADVEALYGVEIYFGEVLGKHSEIEFELAPDMVAVLSDDPAVFGPLMEAAGGPTICGHNPLAYHEEEA